MQAGDKMEESLEETFEKYAQGKVDSKEKKLSLILKSGVSGIRAKLIRKQFDELVTANLNAQAELAGPLSRFDRDRLLHPRLAHELHLQGGEAGGDRPLHRVDRSLAANWVSRRPNADHMR